MRKTILVVLFFMIFQNGLIDASDSPGSFLAKRVGKVSIKQQGESISLTATGSTLEEILQKIADEKKVVLKFYCADPAVKQERGATLTISADSLLKTLRKLVPEDHRLSLFNREGIQTEEGKDVAAVHLYPKDCAQTDRPIRVFIAESESPLMSRAPQNMELEELRDLLRSGGPGSRSRAADILGIKGEEKGIPYVKEALKDENVGVMFAAANALKRLGQKHGGAKVADAVYERFREKPYPEFLPVIAELDRDKIWPIADRLLDRSGDREQAAIARALFLTNDRRAIPYLARIASKGSAENARQALYAIGKIGGREAATALITLLNEGDAERQAIAAQAVHFLPKEDGADARTEVEKIVKKEPVSDVLFYAMAGVSYLEPFEKLLKDQTLKPELKIRALKALAERGGTDKAIETAGIGLNDTAPQVRLATVEAMGASMSEASIPYLVKAAKDEDAKVRRGAIRALSAFPGDDGVVEALGKAVDDKDENVRRDAINALALLGKPNEAMIAILSNCRTHKDPYVANKADSIMTYWGLK
jgi:HEAT repeat protein